MKKTLRKIGIGSALVAGLLTGCNDNPILEGKIIKESFRAKQAIDSQDEYSALVEIQEDTVEVNSGGSKARSHDLRYDVGDSVKVQKMRNAPEYSIVSN